MYIVGTYCTCNTRSFSCKDEASIASSKGKQATDKRRKINRKRLCTYVVAASTHYYGHLLHKETRVVQPRRKQQRIDVI